MATLQSNAETKTGSTYYRRRKNHMPSSISEHPKYWTSNNDSGKKKSNRGSKVKF
jgi:hypothetical protein